ncbi:MAG: hypothetical protein HQL51_06055 [Magnetococcales bacterium]|nr:hypothetical protein [Magnetococcales bacterium]
MALVGLALALTGCATSPLPVESPQQIQHVRERLLADQSARLQGLARWRAEGVIEVRTPRWSGRSRFAMLGEETRRARLSVYGPFQTVARELVLTPGGMHWADATRGEVLNAPANAEGMAWLTGLPIAPEVLLGAALGMTSPGAGGGAPLTLQDAEGMRAGSPLEESWRVEPEAGRLLRRVGATPDGGRFEALYAWPEGASAGAGALTMPQRLRVTLHEPVDSSRAVAEGGEGPQPSRWEMTFSRWEFPASWGEDPFALPAGAVTPPGAER